MIDIKITSTVPLVLKLRQQSLQYKNVSDISSAEIQQISVQSEYTEVV